jgi:hypothetical protein
MKRYNHNYNCWQYHTTTDSKKNDLNIIKHMEEAPWLIHEAHNGILDQ